MYVCFEASMKGFRAGCRQVICIDGCFLKHDYGGQLLSAVGIDANEQYFPIAFAHVEVENKDNWLWFLQLLGTDLHINDNPGWTFISDKQKGLMPALDEVFPSSEKRHCTRHLVTNLSAACGSSARVKELFWEAARATTVSEFQVAMRSLLDYNKPFYDWLVDKPYYHWSRSHFQCLVLTDMDTNNLVESWNNVIVDERDMGPVGMWEGIRRRLMVLYAKRRRIANKWAGPLCKNIEKNLQKLGEEALKWSAESNGNGEFEVRWQNQQVVVNLKKKNCTCRRWDLTGIPCEHAIQAIRKAKLKVYDFVAGCYFKDSCIRIYENSISPTAGREYWPLSQLGDVGVPPLRDSIKRGRPKKARRKEAGEKDSGKKRQKGPEREVAKPVKKKYKCTDCGEVGHNKTFHQNREAKELAKKKRAEAKQKEKEDIQTRKQLERAERNRLAALKKLQAKAAKQASSQVIADGSSQRPASQLSQQPSQDSHRSNL